MSKRDKVPPSQRLDRQRPGEYQDHDDLIQSNRENLEACYILAQKGGASDPVIFIVDPREPSVRPALVQLTGEKSIKENLVRCQRLGIRPMTTFPMSLANAVEMTAKWAPVASRTLRTVTKPSGVFWVVSVLKKETGTSHLTVPGSSN